MSEATLNSFPLSNSSIPNILWRECKLKGIDQLAIDYKENKILQKH